ncbi:hypothetical protein NLU13_4424 [Sarocladium strictum]|uniref:Uncharacterized protein n=1 Tax=Sarocladium strictum TaxID=5046 RepID=A0AA39GKI7_SARSR|nr:hypothetical protein NLU13_4424 [Sarocladium strictum]
MEASEPSMRRESLTEGGRCCQTLVGGFLRVGSSCRFQCGEDQYPTRTLALRTSSLVCTYSCHPIALIPHGEDAQYTIRLLDSRFADLNRHTFRHSAHTRKLWVPMNNQ